MYPRVIMIALRRKIISARDTPPPVMTAAVHFTIGGRSVDDRRRQGALVQRHAQPASIINIMTNVPLSSTTGNGFRLRNLSIHD